MTRMQVNRWAGVAPLLLSGAAFALVLFAVETGWERNLPDEGAAAHIFQLLIAAELPFIALFLWTADRARPSAIRWMLAAQLAAIMIALGPVALFHL